MDGRFCTQGFLKKVEVKPGDRPRTTLGHTELHGLKESPGEDPGAAGVPKGIRIP